MGNLGLVFILLATGHFNIRIYVHLLYIVVNYRNRYLHTNSGYAMKTVCGAHVPTETDHFSPEYRKQEQPNLYEENHL